MSSTHADSDRSGSHAHPANRLAGETSPYLLQHTHNPVDWFPWGPEALERAKAENRPIFLSIGYSACHWCHVMERESFENPDIARIMNAHFVNIKVDREERPDLDQIYMNAVQAMTGRGGWPMSVFLTPDLKPFYGGTYFPPTDSRGMPGFPRVLLSVNRAWEERQDEIKQSAAEMTDRLHEMAAVARGGSADSLVVDHLDRASRALVKTFDALNGGFGHAPKFPHPMDLRVLLRQAERTGDAQARHAAVHTLHKMARGGIYDHLGGGFARYSTDDRWLAPHFEKMLYDNALLTSTYLEALQLSGEPYFGQVALETLNYVLGRMTAPEGGFYSTEDADSEGEEGKFYVWSLGEVLGLLGEERGKTFAYVYDVSPPGNWEGRNILNLPRTIAQAAQVLSRDETELNAELAASRAVLLAAREKRIPPAKDTKVLVSWNGLMIAALAPAGRLLKEPRYLDAARRAAGFILDRMRADDGRLLHTYKDGRATLNAYLDDYACLIDGLTRLYEATGEPRWIEAALDLARVMIDEFVDPEHGGFFFTGKSHEVLITRQKDLFDNATPSGNGMAASALVRLAAITGRDDLDRTGREAIAAVETVFENAPTAAGQSLLALDFAVAPGRELAVVAGSDPREFDQVLEAVHARFLPRAVVAPAAPGTVESLARVVPLLENRPPIGDRATLYYCEGRTCRQPVAGLDEAAKLLAGLDAGKGPAS
ncbi:MAG: thioredoxin domain-containing protein [Paludisphaera borealis]|uniref:thioredoxin domain-containing protein n=1 Tax=Paludisphaera borealis TaxID=1387353 RepID=UPI00283AC186|nr:thioredoxin domain-containing protein [Paludisphaera borealis]MDR3618534.1 thioredoxin domain-containing protein [Paludisphaera borealis]